MPLTFRNSTRNTSATVKLVKVGSPNVVTLYYRKNHTTEWTRFYSNTLYTLGPG